ncbi:MAG: hypothetical protein Q4G66_12980 [bacterium]|nr:hypothetical protein [bacterium]
MTTQELNSKNSSKKQAYCAVLHNQDGSGVLAALLLIAILGVLLMATRPDEDRFRSRIVAEIGLGGQSSNIANIFGELLGTVRFDYSDYIFFSTFSMQKGDKEKKMLAFGVAGQVFTKTSIDQLKSNLEELKNEAQHSLEELKKEV